jgi:hypothetical protein
VASSLYADNVPHPYESTCYTQATPLNTATSLMPPSLKAYVLLTTYGQPKPLVNKRSDKNASLVRPIKSVVKDKRTT